MYIRTQHEIRYIYSGQVYIEPMTVRLRPRSDCSQILHHYRLTVEPTPQGISESVDLDGNSVTCIWSPGLCESLTLTVESTVETKRENPFDFILTDDTLFSLPAKYGSYYQSALDPYLERDYTGDDVVDFAHEMIKKFGSSTITFLTQMNLHIHETFTRVIRDSGDPLSPSELLTRKEGACRDFAVLFIDICRVLGLASRFASGYFLGDTEEPEFQLHAWVEVYLPGAGWRGYDPSHGLAVADRHVVLATGCKPEHAAPTVGMYRGTGITSTLEYHIHIQQVDSLEDIVPKQKTS